MRRFGVLSEIHYAAPHTPDDFFWSSGSDHSGGPGADFSMAAICHLSLGRCIAGHCPWEPCGVLPVRRCSGCYKLPWRQGGQGPRELSSC